MKSKSAAVTSSKHRKSRIMSDSDDSDDGEDGDEGRDARLGGAEIDDASAPDDPEQSAAAIDKVRKGAHTSRIMIRNTSTIVDYNGFKKNYMSYEWV